MTEKELLEQGYRKYTGKYIDVFFNLKMCQHVGNCVRGNQEVFEVKRKPWIIPDNSSSYEIKRIIDTCPSEALKYIIKEEEIFQIFDYEPKRFYLMKNDKLLAEVVFTNDQNLIIISHTFVDPSLRGQKIGSKLIANVVRLAIEENKKIIPLCPFAKKEFEENQSYQQVWHNHEPKEL